MLSNIEVSHVTYISLTFQIYKFYICTCINSSISPRAFADSLSSISPNKMSILLICDVAHSKLDWASMIISSLFNFFPNEPDCKDHNGHPTKTYTHPCDYFHVTGMTVYMVVCVCVVHIFKYQFCAVIHDLMLIL